MKSLSFVLVCFSMILSANAQKADTIKNLESDTTIFSVAEYPPEFPGGNDAFLKYIGQNIRFPADARGSHKQGKVIVRMVIEKDGTVAHVTVLRGLFPSLDAEAVRVVSSSPKWKPGIQNGYPVRVMYSLPIFFKIDNHVYFLKN